MPACRRSVEIFKGKVGEWLSYLEVLAGTSIPPVYMFFWGESIASEQRILILDSVCHFLAVLPPWSNSKMKGNQFY